MAHAACLLLAATAMLAPQLGYTVILEESREALAGQGKPAPIFMGAAFQKGVGAAGGALQIADLGEGLKKPTVVGISADSNGIKSTVGTGLGREKYFGKVNGVPYRVEKSGMGMAVSSDSSQGLIANTVAAKVHDFGYGLKRGSWVGTSASTDLKGAVVNRTGASVGASAPGIKAASQALLTSTGIEDNGREVDARAITGTKTLFGKTYGKIKGTLRASPGKGLTGYMAGIAEGGGKLPFGVTAKANANIQGTFKGAPGEQLAGDVYGTAQALATGFKGSGVGLNLNGKAHVVGPKSSK